MKKLSIREKWKKTGRVDRKAGEDTQWARFYDRVIVSRAGARLSADKRIHKYEPLKWRGIHVKSGSEGTQFGSDVPRALIYIPENGR